MTRLALREEECLWITCARNLRRPYSFFMRARLLPSALLLGVLLLAGCVPQQVDDPIEPAPSATPIFESEDEALAAAVAAYEAYLKVSDEIAADGGANPERLKDLVTAEWYEKEVEGFSAIADSGMFQRGSTTVGHAELQSVADVTDGSRVLLYICVDFSATTFVDANGADVTPGSRASRMNFQVSFESRGPNELLIGGSEPWSASSC